MASALTAPPPAAPHIPRSVSKTDRSIFPDGLQTSGQHSPHYPLLTPYEKYPKEIAGPTVWKAEDYRDNPERWTHVFSDEEIAKLGSAADSFIASGKPLTAMEKVREAHLSEQWMTQVLSLGAGSISSAKAGAVVPRSQDGDPRW